MKKVNVLPWLPLLFLQQTTKRYYHHWLCQKDSQLTSFKGIAPWIFNDGELCRVWLPHVLLVGIVLTCDHHTIGYQEGGVEAHTKLANQVSSLEKKNLH